MNDPIPSETEPAPSDPNANRWCLAVDPFGNRFLGRIVSQTRFEQVNLVVLQPVYQYSSELVQSEGGKTGIHRQVVPVDFLIDICRIEFDAKTVLYFQDGSLDLKDLLGKAEASCRAMRVQRAGIVVPTRN